MLEIDGSYGEGGGQILRTSLSLSCLLKQPFRLFNIRKGRRKPGLMPQHLMCINALRQIANASVSGNTLHSQELFFHPSEIKPGDYIFDIGTAGSTTLLLQAILPPLIFSDSISSVTLRGGTHVPWSPPFHYLSEVFLPMLERLGATMSAEITRYGYYPKGGGEMKVIIHPSRELHSLFLTDREKNVMVKGLSGVSNLPLSIAERQRNAACKILEAHGLAASIETVSVPSPGPGTFLFLKAETASCIAGFSSLGERGKRAETVGEEAAEDLIRYLLAGACLDHHLADQIVLYLALARSSSSVTTALITDHLLTNLQVIRRFTGAVCACEGKSGQPGKVQIGPVR